MLRFYCLALMGFGLAGAASGQSVRARSVLQEGWLIKQIDAGPPDIERLTREARSPDASWLRARMPAQVQDVLFAAGLIPDPHVGRNAAKAAWVWEKDWAYANAFASPPRNHGPVLLRFEGLDTLATAYLNGARIGTFANMSRHFVVDVKEHLAPPGRENILLIVFPSTVRFLERFEQTPEEAGYAAKFKHVRKSDSDFKSYLGAHPNFMKVGIFADVVLDVPGEGWIEDVLVRPELTSDLARAAVRVVAEIAGTADSIDWVLTDGAGKAVHQGVAPVKSGLAEANIDVRNPTLWWPRGHGEQHLYRLRFTLRNRATILDERTVAFGIRRARAILRDAVTGKPRFQFEINGRRIFLMGAGLAPVEGMTHSWRPERAMRLLDLAEQARMNVLRVWGEGEVPPAGFYDECDRRGILIWQDFMFGYGMHPESDPMLLANMRAEIEDVVRSLRNHPSILLWVGGNENFMGYDFAAGGMPSVGRTVFDKIMPEVCARLDPTRIFHPSSPYGGPVPNWPLEGDWHDYSTVTFSPQASVPTFASETGRVSAPSLTSMRRFLAEEDLWPPNFNPAVRAPGQALWPPEWARHNATWEKIGPIEQYPDPASAIDLIRVLGTAHGEYLQQRIERERRGVPDGEPDGNRRCWGNLIWRLNDSWPVIYWSVIDYYLEPKIAYYYTRRAYAPVLVSFEQTADKIAVWVVNDSAESVSGPLVVKRLTFAGQEKGHLRGNVQLAPGEAKRILDLTPFGPVSLRQEFLHAEFDGQEASRLLIGERYVSFAPARLTARRIGNRIEIRTDAFARQVTLDAAGASGAVFEDNFFDLAPGHIRNIPVIDPAGSGEITVRALNAQAIRIPWH